MPYIYSTLAAGVIYTLTKPQDEGRQMPVELGRVEVKGGANVAHEKPSLHTPRGVATEVTDEQLALLRQNVVFQEHVAKGFIHVDNVKVDADNVARDMTKRDISAPRTPEDYVDYEDDKKPKLNITPSKKK